MISHGVEISITRGERRRFVALTIVKICLFLNNLIVVKVQELASSVSYGVNKTILLAPGKSHHPKSCWYGTNPISCLKSPHPSFTQTQRK